MHARTQHAQVRVAEGRDRDCHSRGHAEEKRRSLSRSIVCNHLVTHGGEDSGEDEEHLNEQCLRRHHDSERNAASTFFTSLV